MERTGYSLEAKRTDFQDHFAGRYFPVIPSSLKLGFYCLVQIFMGRTGCWVVIS